MRASSRTHGSLFGVSAVDRHPVAAIYVCGRDIVGDSPVDRDLRIRLVAQALRRAHGLAVLRVPAAVVPVVLRRVRAVDVVGVNLAAAGEVMERRAVVGARGAMLAAVLAHALKLLLHFFRGLDRGRVDDLDLQLAHLGQPLRRGDGLTLDGCPARGGDVCALHQRLKLKLGVGPAHACLLHLHSVLVRGGLHVRVVLRPVLLLLLQRLVNAALDRKSVV